MAAFAGRSQYQKEPVGPWNVSAENVANAAAAAEFCAAFAVVVEPVVVSVAVAAVADGVV